MSKEQAQNQLKSFFEGFPMLTFTIKQYPNDEWTAQCNEIDSIITCGKGYDLANMEELMQDAILTAASIPNQFAADMLKRVWDPNLIVPVNTELEQNTSVSLFQSIYKISDHYAGAGSLSIS